jgi:peptide/nickel transport system substrate-binding protein
MPQRTVAIAVRGEPPSLAIRSVTPFTNALRVPLTLFNATLDWTDERETPFAYLAEALPQVNTESWRVFPDGRMETTYRLKPNLTWHDGAPLSADDFVFAWTVYATPQLGVAASPPVSLMDEVVAADPRTVVIRWRQPYAEAAMLQDTFQALPRHLLQESFQTLDAVAFTSVPFWAHEYVGLGPYRLDRWEPGAFVEARAFDGHALGRAKIDRVKIAFIADPNTALANILAGEVHYVGEFVFADDHAATLEREWSASQGGVALYAPTALRVSVVQLRPEHADPPALVDVRVRRAIAHGVDAALVNEVLNAGKGVITPTLTSPQVVYYSEIERAVMKYPHDDRRAQQLMEEAGFVRGQDGFFVGRDGAPFRLPVWSSSGTKNEQENAVIVDSLRKAGIEANRQVFSAAQLADSQARAVTPGISTRGQASKPLKDYTTEQIPRSENRWAGENRGGWFSPGYDRAYEAFSRALDPNERIRQIAEMEQLFTQELPGIPHWFNPSVTAHVGALKGPVARLTPDVPSGILRVHEWEWRS